MRKIITLVFVAAIALLPAFSFAQPLLLAPPTSTAAHVGDSSAMFDVTATGTPAPTYQWQRNTGSGWADLTNDSSHSGVTTRQVTVISPTLAQHAHLYRCIVTNTGGSVTSYGATLRVFAAPTITPTFTVSPATLSSASTGAVTLSIGGVPAGGTVRIQRFLDANGNGVVDSTEPVVLDVDITDGQRATYGGVLNPNIPGDEDGAANGSITTRFTLPQSAEVGRVAGGYLLRVSSATGAFRPLQQTFTITNPTTTAVVSGAITAGGSPVPHSAVALLSQTNEGRFLLGTVTDANGAYTLHAPAAGAYIIFAIKPGYVGVFDSISVAAGVPTLTDVGLTAATRTISGRITSASNGQPLRGQQIFAESDAGLSIVFSDADGNYSLAVTAAEWGVDISDITLGQIGHLLNDNQRFINATTASQASDFAQTIATSMLYGRILNGSTPLVGVDLFASQSGGAGLRSNALSDSNGYFYLLATGPASSPGDTWFVGATDSNDRSTFIPPAAVSTTVLAGQAIEVNLSAITATAFIKGRVTRDGVPVPNVGLGANPSTSIPGIPLYLGTRTDQNGDYTLPLVAGTWTVHLDNEAGGNFSMVAPIITQTLAENQTLTGVDLAGRGTTIAINGLVRDSSLTPMPGTEIFANATIDGTLFFTSSRTDGSGNYALPAIAGTWNVFINAFYGPGQPVGTVTVASANVTRNFTRSIIMSVTPTTLTAAVGQSTSIVANISSPGAYTAIWQTSLDGTAWTDLTEDDTYSGVTGSVLTIDPVDLTLTGRQYRLRATYNGTTFTSGTRLVTITTPRPVDAWRVANFSAAQLRDPAVSGLTATPAGDGVSNLLKYAFNLPPLLPAASPASAASVNGAAVSLTFQATRTDLTYTVEASTDLVTWTTLGVTTVIDGTTRTASYTAPSGNRAFLRLVVTAP